MPLRDFTPPASVRQVGDPRWRRFIIMDGGKHYWTGRDWSYDPAKARRYLRESDAMRAAFRIHAEDQSPESFKATVVVSVQRGEWTLENLVKYLKGWGRILLMKSQETRVVKVEIHWDGLEAVDGEAEWTRRDT
jgi:hypothetical protein